MAMAQLSRRSALTGLGVGALGLASAALLGCGGSATPTGSIAADEKGRVVGATSGGGLPMNNPVVQGTPREGGTFIAGGATGVQHDPHTALAGNVWHYIGEKGLRGNPVTAALEPGLFQSWEVANKEGTELVFKVHPKLYIHNKPPWNGRQWNAEDAVWNLERIGGLYSEKLKIPLGSFQRASMVANITKAVAVDPLTVKVTLSKPNSGFFNGLWDTRSMFAVKEMDDIGWTEPIKMAGPGSWMLTEWVNDVRTTYVKHPRYSEWRPGQPHFDQLKSLTIPDAVASQQAFISGQTMSIGVTDPSVLGLIRKGRPDANLYTTIDSNWNHLRYSMKYTPFKDYRVRQALHLGFDYKAQGDSAYGPEGGWGYQAALNPGFPEAWSPDKVKAIPGYNPDTKAADIAEGNKLLTAAGFPNGKGLTFEILYSGSSNDNALRFEHFMETAFPEMDVIQKPLGGGATFANRQAENNFQMTSYTITCAPDAGVEMNSQYRTGGSRNYGEFSDPDSDRLIDKIVQELNRDARTQLLEEYQQKWITNWRPQLVLHANAAKQMVQGNIGGYDKIWGIWNPYRSSSEIRMMYFVDK